jgi:peptidoglycan hydrolase CwlO-like protein
LQEKLAQSDSTNARLQQMVSSLSTQVYSFQCTVQDKDREILALNDQIMHLEKELEVGALPLLLRHPQKSNAENK